jgi:hypothetical protein
MFATIEGALLVFRFTLRISKSIHAGYQAPGPHVSPVLVDIVKTGLAARRLMDGSPTCWYVDEVGPERILAFVVNQHHIGAIFVLKWIGHARDSAVIGYLLVGLILGCFPVSQVLLPVPDRSQPEDQVPSFAHGGRRLGEL